MISLIIPVTTSNLDYTNNLIHNIRDLYPNKNEVEIILEENDKVTLGVNYNNAVAKVKGDKIILLHNDMVIKRGFIETMDKHIFKGRITTYTRIEPPIYNDIYPGKVIADFGSDLDTFDENKFNNFTLEESLIDGGSQLFFGCMKEDYIGIDGHTFKMFCEDDDLHLRYKLLHFEHKVSSAHVYHFVSKTSRSTMNYKQIEFNSNRNFVRKWGFRTSRNNTKYNIGFIIKNCNYQILSSLEPWCSNIYVDYNYEYYIKEEQLNTIFNLQERIKPYDCEKNNDIIISFDANDLNQQSFDLIQQFPDIIKDSGEIGSFELDIFKIDIFNMKEYQHNLVYLK